jgi:hypothetical protein
MYELKIDLPNSSQDAPVELDGLGLFENGKTYIISDEDANDWRSRSTRPGNPTLLQAFKTTTGITIKKVDAGEPDVIQTQRPQETIVPVGEFVTETELDESLDTNQLQLDLDEGNRS